MWTKNKITLSCEIFQSSSFFTRSVKLYRRECKDEIL